MNENEPGDHIDYPLYATAYYMERMHPGLDLERRMRQEEIAKRISHMLTENYYREIRENREQWWRENVERQRGE